MLSEERLREIRDFDTCVTLEESAEMSRQLLALTPIYQERRYHDSGKKQIEYWGDVSTEAYQHLPESERRIVYVESQLN